jgi:AcrR family transcriptional regulator
MAQQPRTPLPDRLFEAAMALAATKPWHRVTLAEIAAEAKVGLGDLHGVYRSRTAILVDLSRRVDAAMLAVEDKDAAEASPRERLLDVLMRRFDALEKHKDAVASILRSGGEPLGALRLGGALVRSMGWTLEAAGIASGGVIGRAQAQALAAIYASAVLVWLRDDSPDLGKTMAHLDHCLRRAERFQQAVPSRRPAAPRPAAS